MLGFQEGVDLPPENSLDLSATYCFYARKIYDALGESNEAELVSVFMAECPRALFEIVENKVGSPDKLINWILFWANDDCICTQALQLYFENVPESEKVDLFLHALKFFNANAVRRLWAYLGPLDAGIQMAIDQFLWEPLGVIVGDYRILLEAKGDEDIGWKHLDPYDRIDGEPDFKRLASLIGPISLCVYLGYSLPEKVLAQFVELDDYAQSIDVREKDDWFYDNPTDQFFAVAQAFQLWHQLDQVFVEFKKISAQPDYAVLALAPAQAAFSYLFQMVAQQVWSALVNLTAIHPCFETLKLDFPSVTVERADFRAQILNVFLQRPILSYQEWQFLEKLMGVVGKEDDIVMEVRHRRHSGLAAALWDRALDAHKYVTAILQPDGQYFFYALPLIADVAGPEVKDKAELALLTSLFYHHNKKKDWSASVCEELRWLLVKLNPDLVSADVVAYQARHEALEHSDYYAECPSDDSEGEHVQRFEAEPLRVRNALLGAAKKMMVYGQVDNIWVQSHKKFLEPKKAKVSDTDPSAASFYDITARAEIHHDEALPYSVQIDLASLTAHALAGTLNAVTLGEIATQFFVAQYRGIHYDATSWSQRERRAHRQGEPQKQTVYAPAVYKKAGVVRSNTVALDDPQKARLDQAAQLIHHQVTSLQYTGHLRSGASGQAMTFDQAGDAVQDFYTKKYQEHADFCARVKACKDAHQPISNPLDVAFLFANGPDNYNQSTGDTPYHASRYALGLKRYDGKGESLSPRWRRDGKAERPYVGKIYTMLFDIKSYDQCQPYHLVSADYTKRVNIDAMTLSERETKFVASIPGAAVAEHVVVRYPNFSGDYQDYYLHKYGMDAELYAQFKNDLFASVPGSPERKRFEILLSEHLCAYQDACLIEDARLLARKRGGWLIYRDATGGFSFVPPQIKPAIRGERAEAGAVVRARQDAMVAEKRQREPDGWLHQKLQAHNILPVNDYRELIEILHQKTRAEIEAMIASRDEIVAEVDWMSRLNIKSRPGMHGYVKLVFQDTLDGLFRLARALSITIKIESFLFDLPIILHEGQSNELSVLYLGGDGFHGIVDKSWRLEVAPSASATLFAPGAVADSVDRARQACEGYKKARIG